MELDASLEAVLFFKGEPLSAAKLAKMLGRSEGEILDAAESLRSKLAGRGLELIKKDGELALGTAREASELIEGIVKEELNRDLGKAALETLTIVLYEGPISRAEIDYIRGVNSASILRNLTIRGLVERVQNPNDSRGFLYRPTFELWGYLGIADASELPEAVALAGKIDEFLASREETND